MKHLNAINRKAARVVAATAGRRRRPAAGRQPPQQPEAPHIPPGCSLVFSPGWEADHAGGTAGLCSAGGTRPVRLPHGLLLAGAGARSAQSRARLDRQVRRGPEGLAQDRPGVPGMRSHMRLSHGRCGGRRACRRRSAAAPSRPEQGRPRPRVTGGNGKLYIGTYNGEIEIYDEATEKIEDKIVLKTGIPRSITPSPDRTRFYALNSRFEEIEVVDIASRKTINSFKLSSGNKHMRVNNLQPDPINKLSHADEPHGDQARRPLGDRTAYAAAVRPDHPPVHADHSVAARRRAGDGEHALLGPTASTCSSSATR